MLVRAALMMLVACVTPAFAETDPDCFDRARLKEIEGDFEIKDHHPDGKYVHCDLSNAHYKLRKSLLYLKDLGQILAAEGEWDLGVLSESPYRYVKEGASQIIFSDWKERCEDDALGYAFPSNLLNDGVTRIFICPLYGSLDIDVVQSATTLVHEARHTHPESPSHVECNRPPANRYRDNCDESYESRGAYGIETLLNVRVAFSGRINSAVRARAKAFASVNLLDRFNQRSLGIREGVALLTTKGEVRFFDGKNLEFMTQFPANFSIMPSTSMLSAVDAKNARYYVYTHADIELSMYQLHYKPLQTATLSERREFLDMAFLGTALCRLFRHRVSCHDMNNEADTAEIDLSVLEAESFVRSTPNSYLEKDALYVLDYMGRLYRLPSTLAEMRETKQLKLAYPSIGALSSLAFLEDGRAIAVLGDMALVGNPSRGFKLIPGLEKDLIRKVNGPIVWSKKLHQLSQRDASEDEALATDAKKRKNSGKPALRMRR